MKWHIRILVFLVVLNVGWNIFLYLNPDKQTFANYAFNFSYGLIFFFASFIAFLGTLQHGLHSTLGKSFASFTVAFSSYGIALLTWIMFNLVLKTSIPYPGVPDIFFLLFHPFSIMGFILFVKHLGGKFTWLRLLEFTAVFSIFFFMLYLFLNQFGLTEALPALTRVLNITYPAFDAIMVALVIIAIRTEEGSFHPNLLLFAFAYLFLAAADTLFAYRTAIEIYWNGDIADTMYLIASMLFALSMISTLSTRPRRLD